LEWRISSPKARKKKRIIILSKLEKKDRQVKGEGDRHKIEHTSAFYGRQPGFEKGVGNETGWPIS